MVAGSGPVVMGVLVALLAISLLCWTIIIVKLIHLKRVERENEEFIYFFESTSSLERLESRAMRLQDRSPMAAIFTAAMVRMKSVLERARSSNRKVPGSAMVEMLEREMTSTLRLDMKDLEYAVPVLATTGNAAPFIGLFGTVWGIMKSFHGIGLKGSASLATVAPGISEALVATAAGLAAAIPAVIAYNLFMTKLQRMEQELESFKESVLNRLELEWLAGGQRPPRGTGRQEQKGQVPAYPSDEDELAL
jgi:biopolymer transport protein TolQ